MSNSRYQCSTIIVDLEKQYRCLTILTDASHLLLMTRSLRPYVALFSLKPAHTLQSQLLYRVQPSRFGLSLPSISTMALIFPFLHTLAAIYFMMFLRCFFRDSYRGSCRMGRRRLKRMQRCCPMVLHRSFMREAALRHIVRTTLWISSVFCLSLCVCV